MAELGPNPRHLEFFPMPASLSLEELTLTFTSHYPWSSFIFSLLKVHEPIYLPYLPTSFLPPAAEVTIPITKTIPGSLGTLLWGQREENTGRDVLDENILKNTGLNDAGTVLFT